MITMVMIIVMLIIVLMIVAISIKIILLIIVITIINSSFQSGGFSAVPTTVCSINVWTSLLSNDQLLARNFRRDNIFVSFAIMGLLKN